MAELQYLTIRFVRARRGSELLPIILETHKPEDLIILMLGTNDCKTFYGATAGSIGLGIRKLVRQIRDGAPSAKILLMSPIALGEKVWDGFDTEFGKNSVPGVQRVAGDLPADCRGRRTLLSGGF